MKEERRRGNVKCHLAQTMPGQEDYNEQRHFNGTPSKIDDDDRPMIVEAKRKEMKLFKGSKIPARQG